MSRVGDETRPAAILTEVGVADEMSRWPKQHSVQAYLRVQAWRLISVVAHHILRLFPSLKYNIFFISLVSNNRSK